MTYRTAVLTNSPRLDGATVYKPSSVSIKLNVHGFTTDGATEIVRVTYATINADGSWTSEPLVINDDIDPANTYYTVRESGVGQLWTVKLTAAHAGTTVALRSALVVDPTNPNPIAAGTLPFTISNTPTAVGQVLVVTDLSPLTLAYMTPDGSTGGGGSTPSPNLTFGGGVYGAGVYSPAA